MFPPVLLPMEADPVLEEKRGKGNPGRPRSSSGSKIVLTLLTKVVVVHMGLSAVHVRGTGFQLLAGCLGNDGSRSVSGSRNESRNGSKSENRSRNGNLGLQTSLKNLLQVIFEVLGDIISSSGSVSNGGFCRESSGLVGQFVT